MSSMSICYVLSLVYFQCTHIPYLCIYIYITITGVQIEEPFGILPMAYICNNIKDMGVELLQDTGIELTVPPSPPVVPVVFPGYTAVTSTSTGHNSDPVYHAPVNIMPPIRDASMLTIINATTDIALPLTTTNATSTTTTPNTTTSATASLLHTDSSNDSNSIARLVPILTPSEVQDILSAVPLTNTTDGLTDGLTGGLIGGVSADSSSGRESREGKGEGLSGSPLGTSSGTGNRILEPVGSLNQQCNNTSDTNNTNGSINSIKVDDTIIHIQLVTTEMFLDSLEEKKS